jgi:oligopeptide transport system permease protein
MTERLEKGTSLRRDAFSRRGTNRAALSGGIVVLLMIVACFGGPWVMRTVWGYTYEAQNLAYGAKAPTWAHWFGTDYYGRDLFTRVLFGGQISLAVGFLLPYMFIVIVLVAILGKDIRLLFVALGLVGWLTTARIVRGQVLSLKERDFVLAARSVGARTPAIIFRHLIRNTLGPVIVYFTLTVPSMILQEAFLSFLGLGVQAPRPSLGALLSDGAAQMGVFWWQLVFPGAAMALLLLSLNFLGDGLRDALDPEMKR